MPKERFISYPGAIPDSDRDSLLIGWAGWDHKDQATALIGLIGERSTTDGWDTGRLTQLLAGLLEVMPWVRQWHNELGPAFGQSAAEACDGYLTSERESRNLTEHALRTWTPPQSSEDAAAARKPLRQFLPVHKVFHLSNIKSCVIDSYPLCRYNRLIPKQPPGGR